jgi:hypothetical protein
MGTVRLTRQARSELGDDEALVFDWHRIAICCASAGDVSLRCSPRERIEASGAFRPLDTDPPASVYAHRLAYPHLAARPVRIDCRRRLGMRRFSSDLPSDFGLRAVLGRLPDRPEEAS